VIESIDEETCDGCNVCIDSCPTGVIRLVEGDEPWATTKWRAKIIYPNDCHSCRLCAIDCHVDAIVVSHELVIPEPFLPKVERSGGPEAGKEGAPCPS
jgi:NAD-dependent dihydropyrimidine dehydrogenase PreA subunit